MSDYYFMRKKQLVHHNRNKEPKNQSYTKRDEPQKIMKTQENKPLQSNQETVSDSVHLVLVGLDEHFGNTENGKHLNPAILKINVGIPVDTNAIVTIAISCSDSSSKSEKISLSDGIQEIWHYVSGSNYKELGTKMVVSFIPFGLFKKLHFCKLQNGESLLHKYIRQSKVNHIAFCDFFPFKSDAFNRMVGENWHKEYNYVTKSILIVKGLNNFSENDISTESDSVKDAQEYYKEKEWNTVVCTKQITALDFCQSLATGLSLRKDRVREMLQKINDIIPDPVMLGVIAEVNDLGKKEYKSIGDFVDNAIGKMLEETLMGDYAIFQIVCPDWKIWVEERLKSYSFPTTNVSKTKEALNIIIEGISDYYHKQAKQFQQR